MNLRTFEVLILGVTLLAADPKSDLFSSIRSGDVKLVQQATSKGADVNGRRGDGLTPLMYASIWGRKNVVELLLNSGADAKALQGGCNAACYAHVVEKYEIRDLLKARGASIALEGLQFGIWQVNSLLTLPSDEFEAVAPAGIKNARKQANDSKAKAKMGILSHPAEIIDRRAKIEDE